MNVCNTWKLFIAVKVTNYVVSQGLFKKTFKNICTYISRKFCYEIIQ